MPRNLQPKSLFELAFESFITFMENEARQLLKLDPTPEAVTVATRVCRELKRFFHGTRLPTFLMNQLTKHLLIKLDHMYSIFWTNHDTECWQQMLLSLVEVFMHPDVTAIELGPNYLHRFDLTACLFITWNILQKVCDLHNLKILNLPPVNFNLYKEFKPGFPCQLKELTVHWMTPRGSNTRPYTDIFRSIAEFCPELKSLTMCGCNISYLEITHLLQCIHLESLRLRDCKIVGEGTDLTAIDILSTDTTSDMLSASPLKAFSSVLKDQNSLRVVVDKLPHLTEIELHWYHSLDLSSLTQLKNLRSLSLEALYYKTANEYKQILPVLGKNLVFLELINHHGLDLEFIGETCTNLKCLHVIQPVNLNHSLKTIPNFKTIECLKVILYHEEDFVPFLVAQCVNIKTFVANLNHCNLNTTVEDVLRRTPPLNCVVIMYNSHESVRNGDFIESLPSRHPSFRVVKGYNFMRFSSQGDVFDSFGCYI